MCGIAGFYGFRNDNLLKKFSQELAHRGPDGEGTYINDKVSLLNRRLAIIDIEGGNQPIYNEDKSVAVVYNGEIYNYQELKQELKRKGHVFKTKSDTEVIVHGYEEWKEKCFDKFNGMFAIALYDKKGKKLILARDHFGIKPLYYSLININKTNFFSSFKLVFSSEIKPIFYSGLIPKRPNDRIIYRYLKYRIHDDSDQTFFEGINRLMPGEIMIIQNSKCKVQSYTNLKKELLEGKEIKKLRNEEIKIFRDKLIEAIKLRLISDVSVGTCLSGGLDSSTIVFVVNKLLKENIQEAKSVGKTQKTFSAIFPGFVNDEEEYIDELVQSSKLKVQSYKINPKPEEFFEEIEDFVRTQEEPTISTGPYSQYKVMQEAKKYIKVLLDGQGIDEILAGYLPYYFVYLRELWENKRYSDFVKEAISSSNVITKYFWYLFQLKVGIKKQIRVNNLLSENFNREFKNERFTIESNNLKKRLIEDIFVNSLPSLLRYEDKNSMRFSIEGRVPFLDFGLIKYVFSLDEKAIIKDGWNKSILRESVKDLLPEKIVKRRNKIGFTTPEVEWFLRMKNRINTIFTSDLFAKRKYFHQKEIVQAFQQFIEGKTDDSMVFWRILNIELWLRIFIDEEKVVEEKKERDILEPNADKKIEIEVNKQKYLRFPIRTDLIKKGDDVTQEIRRRVVQSINRLYMDKKYQQISNKKWFAVVSEKIVAIAQGRSYFIWDINPSFLAIFLSKYVRKTPYGIGLGSPWTMQLAINEVGLPRILFASLVSFITKLFGFKGIFYQIAGREAASIDGPTEYSLYPSNVSAKLGPKDPEKVAEDIHKKIISNSQFPISDFLGVVILDANDLGQNVLGNSTSLDNSLIEKIFKDNPMGQASEQTPIVVVYLV